jgi:hypothetical protein
MVCIICHQSRDKNASLRFFLSLHPYTSEIYKKCINYSNGKKNISLFFSCHFFQEEGLEKAEGYGNTLNTMDYTIENIGETLKGRGVR